MNSIEYFLENFSSYQEDAKVVLHSKVEFQSKKFPLVSIHYGNPSGPTLFLTGGVHGLERIGAQLSLSFLDSFRQRLSWDDSLRELLKKIQVVFLPVVNPVGYIETTRANGNGVDLARNAPIESKEKLPFLLGGHSISDKIPWFRGNELQQETEFVLSTLKSVLDQSECVISLDIHSGFGMKDQIWFPFAGSNEEFTQLNEFYLLFELYNNAHPYHIYQIEPQSNAYLTDGDMWDYGFHNYRKPSQTYIPLTLEMGSWIWVKKNPLQLFSKTGLFNPIKEHRRNRTLRRHRPLFDFILQSLYSHQMWTKPELVASEHIRHKAREKYYGKR